ncbi:MAG TPA: hypothetical protein VH120_11520 [Gemmataceae bacterium]|nr:hypothetical protein [Gemmataceae bacterium]
MTDRVRTVLETLTPDERQQVLNALLIEHFAAGEQEVPVEDGEGILHGYLTTPGVHSCYQLGIDPKDMPPELAGPYYPAGYTIAQLERMEADAAAEAAAVRP